MDALYKYKQNPVAVHKDSIFKPDRFTKKTDVDTWWTRFELYLKTVPIAPQNLRTIFMGFLDDECIKTFDNCTPKTYLTPEQIHIQMKKLFGQNLIDRDEALEKFYNRKPGRDEQMTDFFSDLWHLANVAFGTGYREIDAIVKDRFIRNVTVPYIQLELRNGTCISQKWLLRTIHRFMQQLDLPLLK